MINEYCSMGIEILEEQVNGKEVVDMCKAVEEIREEGRLEGRVEGERVGENRGRNSRKAACDTGRSKQHNS